MQVPSIAGLESFEPLSQSSTAFTWRAYQRALDRHVMVKMLLPEAAADPQEVERFNAVSSAISRIKAESFCQIFDIANIDGTHYAIMEDASGPTLSDKVRTNPQMPVKTVLRYALSLANALGKAWNATHFVHRNLKPTTIHITPEGIAKLADLSNAILATPGTDFTRFDNGMIVGTPNFIAPEQVDHAHPIDCRTDMYALGALLYFAFTGQIPFADEPPEQVVRSQVSAVLPNPRKFRPDLPLSVCALIERLMMKHPSHRYATWSEVITDLKRLIDGNPLRRSPLLGTGLSTIAVPDGEPSSATRRSRHTGTRRPTGPAAFFRFILWLVLAAWLLLFGNHRLGDPYHLYEQATERLPVIAPYLPSLPAKYVQQSTPSHTEAPAPLRLLPHSAIPQATTPVVPPPPQPTPQPAVITRDAPTKPLPDTTVHRALVAAYKQNGISGMQELAETLPKDNSTGPQNRRIRNTLATLEPLDTLTARALEKTIGTEIDLVYLGKMRRVVPKAIADGKVTLFFNEQRRDITLVIANLDDTEKIRLLGDNLTPTQAAVVCIHLLETGKRDAARPYAAAAGPLTPVLNLLTNE